MPLQQPKLVAVAGHGGKLGGDLCSPDVVHIGKRREVVVGEVQDVAAAATTDADEHKSGRWQ